MNRYLYIVVAILSLSLCSCENSFNDSKLVYPIAGRWVSLGDDNASNSYIEFIGGYIYKYQSSNLAVFAEGELWMCKKEDFNKVGFCRYSVNNGVLSSSLYNGRIKFGEDTFEINGETYYRLQGFSSEYYRKIDIGKSKELITNFAAKEISIPYTIINGLKDTKLNVSTTANWIKWIAVTEGTIALSVDTSSENRSGTIRLSCLGAEDVVLELQQVSDYIINVEEEEIILDYHSSSQSIPYSIVNADSNKVLTAMCNADWIQDLVVTDDAVNFGVLENNDKGHTQRKAEIVLSYPEAEALTITVIQRFDEPVISVDINNENVGYMGGTIELKYSIANHRDTAVVGVVCSEEWFACSKCDEGVISLDIAENLYGRRKGSVLIKYTVDGTTIASKSLKIVQDHNPSCELHYETTDGKIISVKASSFGENVTIEDHYISSNLATIVFNKPITQIGERAFSSEDTMKSITIPDSVTEIGDFAFSYCSSLTSVTIPDSVTEIGDFAFSHCSSLTSVTIPDSVTEIGDFAFSYCSSLTSVTIPDSVTYIGDGAFLLCSSLEEVYISDLSAWCRIDFGSSNSNPLNNGAALYINGELATDITIPSDITQLKQCAFIGCNSLTSVTIPDSVTTIGTHAFFNCSSLEEVYISDLSAWCRIDFGSTNANPLGNGAKLYINNTELTELTIPSDVLEIKRYTFFGGRFSNVTIPDGVTSIGKYAFQGCSGELIVNCNIPSASGSVDGVFHDSEFTKVTIGDSVTTIGNHAFDSCSSLTSVTIPDSVTTIGESAFLRCESLKIVYCMALTPPNLGDNVFKSIKVAFDWQYVLIGCKIYVPMESVNKYKYAVNWEDYSSDIVGYDF